MPFELGLAVAIAELSDNQHQFFMFESMANRVLKSLSDMNGLQVFIHENTPEGVLQGMLAIFETPNGHWPGVA